MISVFPKLSKTPASIQRQVNMQMLRAFVREEKKEEDQALLDSEAYYQELGRQIL